MQLRNVTFSDVLITWIKTKKTYTNSWECAVRTGNQFQRIGYANKKRKASSVSVRQQKASQLGHRRVGNLKF